MKKQDEFVSQVLSLRKSGKSWDEIEHELNERNLLQNHGTNKQLFADLKAMEGKSLRKVPQEELHRLFAEIMSNNPELKPMEVRDQVWKKGVHCYRQDYSAFEYTLKRRGNSVDQFLREEADKQEFQPAPHDQVLSDLLALKAIVARMGKDNVLRALQGLI
jgi:hypothetical protein